MAKDGTGVTAKTHLDRARTLAQENWASEVKLSVIVGMEGYTQFARMGSYDMSRQGGIPNYYKIGLLDTFKGDGHSRVWMYKWVSPNEKPDKTLEIALNASGSVVHAEEAPRGSRDDPLGNWELDSDEATATVMEESKELRKARDMNLAQKGFVNLLYSPRMVDGPIWLVGGGGFSEEDSKGVGGVLSLDAATGEIGQGPMS